MRESEVRAFWEEHPCGESMVRGLSEYGADFEAFFRSYDEFRYSKEPHILDCLKAIDFDGKRVLEIGLGQGADAERISRSGADWFGIDLTFEAVRRTALRFGLRGLSGAAVNGSALALPFADDSFDIVFSHGVLHHIPEIQLAQKEIRRVLRPDGELIVMLYARNSVNYRVAISVVRRLALAACYLTGREFGGVLGEHLANARRQGLAEYLKMENFIHRNTDGPANPYSKVYDLQTVRSDFPDFEIVKAYKRFMHAPPLPVRYLPLERLAGWHLWLHLRPVKGNERTD